MRLRRVDDFCVMIASLVKNQEGKAMNEESVGITGERRTYEAPRLHVIELVTDEVLGSGCKTVTDIAPTGLCGTSSCGNMVGS